MKIVTRYRIDRERTKWGYCITWYTHITLTHFYEGEILDTIEPYDR